MDTLIRTPTFFLAGVPKAGTTSLYFYLAQHPQVFMSPIKEPNFFAAADMLARPGVLRSLERDRSALRAYLNGPRTRPAWHDVFEWDDYLTLFRNARGETAIGEASVNYFFQPSAAPAIRAKLPEARLLFMLRDPAERLFSWYLMNLRRYPGTTFRAWFRAARNPGDAVNSGRYATHLARFCAIFPRDQMRMYLYDAFRADARGVLRDMFEFIGVNPDSLIDMSRRHNEARVPRFPVLHRLRQRIFGYTPVARWLPAWMRGALTQLYTRRAGDLVMDPADRRMVIDYYRDEIERTAALIGRDLSAWLR